LRVQSLVVVVVVEEEEEEEEAEAGLGQAWPLRQYREVAVPPSWVPSSRVVCPS